MLFLICGVIPAEAKIHKPEEQNYTSIFRSFARPNVDS